MTTLRDVLTAPFMFRSESLPLDSGGWSRVASYPELDCEARGEIMMDMLDELELRRVQVIVNAVENGDPVVPVRPPIADDGVEELLARAGLSEWIARLDEDVLLVARRSSRREDTEGRR